MISKILKILGLQQSFSRSLEQFFLTVGQNNFGNKIPLFNDLPSVANLTNSDSFKMKKTKKQVVQTPEN